MSAATPGPADNLRDDERLGRLLLDRGLISPREYDLVRRQAEATGLELWRLILSLNLVPPAVLATLAQRSDAAPSLSKVAAPETNLREDLIALVRSGDVSALVGALFQRAHDCRATDIHFDPRDDGGLRVRYRVDGELQDILVIPVGQTPAVISRVKVLANMNILEKRDSQDGHIVERLGERNRNMRIASVPTHLGERIVARLMDETAVTVDLDQLGFSHGQVEAMGRLLRRPHGVIVVTGPVGSGKTTTLYSCLARINTPALNIMTIEDPVEFRLPGVNQLQVDPRNGWTFPKALRAMLRQDPDVMMVGEIRDEETAKIAVRASLTGDLVLTTMHANDAASAIATLANFGIPPYLLSTSLLGVIAQRLVRKVNEASFEEYPADARVRGLLGLKADDRPGLKLRRGVGDTHDMGTGYLGRTGVFEVMELDDGLRDLVRDSASKDVIQAAAVKRGMTTIRGHAVEKVIAGVTTIEEVFRVGLL